MYSGIVSVDRFIYVFGANFIRTAEVYDGKNWNYLPELPFGSYGVMCVEYRKNIMLFDETEQHFYRFSPKTQEYTQIQIDLQDMRYAKLGTYKDNLILIGID